MNLDPCPAKPFPKPPRLSRRAALLVLLAALLVPLATTGGLAATETVVVIVNSGNPVTELSSDEVSKMFLKKTSRWPGKDDKVLPVDLVDQSPLREAFSKQIHGKGTAAIKAYWQRMIFTGHDVPPPEKPSIAEALSYVRANPGAIGYAPAGADLGSGIKVLKVTQ
jgi:ABC-type phosphate transport system substrate-binding protein